MRSDAGDSDDDVIERLLARDEAAPTPDGGQMPMAMIGQIVGSPTVGAGWIYHLFNSAVIGAIFGWLLGDRAHNFTSALGWGATYGFVWWIVGGLILMPPMRMMAMGSTARRGA